MKHSKLKNGGFNMNILSDFIDPTRTIGQFILMTIMLAATVLVKTLSLSLRNPLILIIQK